MPLHERVAGGHFTTKFSNLGHTVPRGRQDRSAQSPHKETRIRGRGGERGGEPLFYASPRAAPAQQRPRSADATRGGAEDGPSPAAGLGFVEPNEKWKWLTRLQSADSEPGFRPSAHPSSLQACFEGMALFGEPAPQTTQRCSDYCSPHGPFPNKTERELARDEERERERKRHMEREIDRTIREVSLLRERERGRELGATGPEEEAGWETAKLAVQKATHSGGAGRQGRDDAKGRQGATAAILDKRERSLTSIGARLRVRRAHALQLGAFAILRDEYSRAEHLRDLFRSITARFLKFSSALHAYNLQVRREMKQHALAMAARHSRGWPPTLDPQPEVQSHRP
jgi:hypothetical protein